MTLQPRITAIDWNGTPAWRKCPETLSLRYRIQKGNAKKLFRKETKVYEMLAERGLPGPEILDAGPDYLVMKDAGPTLKQFIENAGTDPDLAAQAMEAAASELARLHLNGVAHGRPAPRDICWQDGRVTFLDWESHRSTAYAPKSFARDFAIFVYSAIGLARGVPPGLQAASASYLEAVPSDVVVELRTLTKRAALVERFLRPLLKRFQHKKDIAAIAPTVQFLQQEIRGRTDGQRSRFARSS